MKNGYKGAFITFEGPEGSGKTTQSSRLVSFCRDKGLDVVYTREPGGTLIGDYIRSILLDPKNSEMVPKTELLLYAAGRSQHVEETILPSLKQGKVVICDRFMDATTAYQGYGRQIDMELIETLNRIAVGSCEPDLTILLDIEASRGLRKAIALSKDESAGRPDRMEELGLEFHRRVRAGYKKIFEENPQRVHYIYVSRDEEQIFQDILAAVTPVLKRKGILK